LLNSPKGDKKPSGVLPDKPKEASKMKRFYKLLGIAVIAAVIAIGLAGCSDGGGGGGIQITQLHTSALGVGTIFINVGGGLSDIDIADFTAQDSLKASFQITSNGAPIDVGAVYSSGAIVNGVSSMELTLSLLSTYTFTSGTAYNIKVKYTKGTTPNILENGSELDSFEIEKNITAE
jgi:hypothetical protein